MIIYGYEITAMDGVLLLCALYVILPVLRKILFKPANKLGIDGKLIWVDKGRTKPFYNKEFKVLGKPDLMYKIKKGILAVEYKHRKSNIYVSDIAQAKAAALAARGDGYNVTEILIKTKNDERKIALPKSDRELYASIKQLCNTVRDAKKGRSLKALPSKFKCLNCAYENSCLKKA